MTLIVAMAADEYVIVVSDRRLTWFEDGQVTHRDDNENKTILLCGHYLMGYTGIARIKDKPLQQWLVETLATVSPDRYFSTLSQAAETEFRQIQTDPPDLKRHAFIAVGFTATRDNLRLQASAVIVANCAVAENGSMGPVTGFMPSGYLLDRDFVIRTIGYTVPRRFSIEALDLIRRYRQRFPARPQGAAQVLVSLARKVSAISNGYVGEDVLVSILPRLDVPAQAINVPLGIVPDCERRMTCMSLLGEGESEVADFYGPATVCPGIATLGSELWVGRRPPWWAEDVP
jgi:hypothetical protein